MSWLGKIVAICFFVVILGVSALIGMTRSLWFLTDLIPTQGSATMIGIRQSPGLQQITTELYKQGRISDQIAQYIPQLSRAVFIQDGENRYVVVIPTIAGQRTVPTLFTQDGWRVHRYGWIMIAAPREEVLPALSVRAFQEAAQHFWLRMAQNNMPYHPVALVSVPEQIGAFHSRGFTILATEEEKTVAIRATEGSQQYEKVLALSPVISRSDISERDFTVQIPAKYLATIPSVMKQQWQERIAKELGLIHTKPKFITSVNSESHIFVMNNARGDIAFALKGNTNQFVSDVREHIEREAGYDNPVKQSFRLPDGTLGYEYVPSEVSNLWSEDKNGCMKAQSSNVLIHMCRHDDWIVLANSLDAVSLARQSITDTFHISIPSDWTNILPLQALQSLFIEETPQGYTASIQLK